MKPRARLTPVGIGLLILLVLALVGLFVGSRGVQTVGFVVVLVVLLVMAGDRLAPVRVFGGRGSPPLPPSGSAAANDRSEREDPWG